MADKALVEKEANEVDKVFDYSTPKWLVDDDSINPGCTAEENKQWAESICNLLGTKDIDYMMASVKSLLGVVGYKDESINGIMAALQAINPCDELEGMLAVQMVGIHHLSMTMMHRAANGDQPSNVVQDQVNRVTKLSRTFIAQLEALNKHRGKGQQKMTVEHIHVNEGGQAVIGNLEQRRGGENKK